MYQTLISAETLKENLDRKDWAVVDCRFWLAEPERGERDYRRAHIPGAVYAHLDRHLSAPVIAGRTGRHPLPEAATFARTLSGWGIGAGVQVVAYDDSDGAIAARLWWMLRWLGHNAVAVLDGGWAGWQAKGYPARSGEERRPPRPFTPRPRPELLASVAEVEALRTNSTACLLDARNADRYRGENETIDPVAGHIPGAISAPYVENLTAEGHFRPAAELRARFAALLGDTPPQRTVVYCGSGVTAAHNLLAMLHAGLGEARLYAGSWSEWITDPSRPVATGPA